MSQQKTESASVDELPFVAHLIELRDRLLRGILVVIVILMPMLYFANDIYTALAEPLLRHLPQGSSMIAIEVASPFLTPFKLALVLSIFIGMPFLLYQLWAFIAPGLYSNEKRMAIPLMISSAFLFYAGMAFAYFVVFPLIFGFLTSVAPQGVSVMTDIGKYLDFVLKLFFAFGIAFEVPIATILLVWAGVTTPDKLSNKRPYIIVGAFVIGMLLTPPDIISQTLLAIPMWLLFELGVFFSRRFVRKREPREESEQENSIAPQTAPLAAAAPDTGARQETETDAKAESDDENFRVLSDEEMDDELDRLEAEEEELNREEDEPAPDEDASKPSSP